jgi:hypothetical protein
MDAWKDANLLIQMKRNRIGIAEPFWNRNLIDKFHESIYKIDEFQTQIRQHRRCSNHE